MMNGDPLSLSLNRRRPRNHLKADDFLLVHTKFTVRHTVENIRLSTTAADRSRRLGSQGKAH
jgi:hypothetical protein